MSIPNKRERKVQPTHPGVMLREDFLPEYGLTVSGFAKALWVVAPDGERVASGATCGQSEDGVAALSVIRQQSGVLVECSAGSRSLGGGKEHQGQDQSHFPSDRCLTGRANFLA